jgi:polysaccharide export outer membrane protein
LVALALPDAPCCQPPGPSIGQVTRAAKALSASEAGIAIIDVNDAVAREIVAANHQVPFSQSL